MVTPIGMPKVGTSMIEGRVVAWAVAVGDAVAAGQTVVVDAVPLPR